MARYGLQGPILSGTGFYMKREALYLYGNYSHDGMSNKMLVHRAFEFLVILISKEIIWKQSKVGDMLDVLYMATLICKI